MRKDGAVPVGLVPQAPRLAGYVYMQMEKLYSFSLFYHIFIVIHLS